MQTKSDTGEAGGDMVPASPAFFGRLRGRTRRTSVERLRRSTAGTLLVGVFFAWLGVFTRLTVENVRVPVVVTVLDVAGTVVFTVLYVRILRASIAGTRADREIVASGALALVMLALLDGELWSLGLLAIAWSSGAVLLLDRRGAIAASVGAAAVAVALVPSGNFKPNGDPLLAVVAFLAMAVFMPWTNRFQLWFWKVVRSAEEGKEAMARLAVTEERLRFSRDLHDLVGHSLSAIALKSEVAVKLSGADVERAAAEMDEVRALAREALKEIRTAVRGYRTVDLDAELRSMTAVLEAGGIACSLELPREEVPEELATLLSWVIREGTTNVLRHSSATRCRIAIVLREGTAVLEMTNDGATRPGGRGGTGLTGMSERVTAMGGVLTAGAGEGAGEFRLRATIPLEGTR
ncbi:sensor histidine kinase [Streptosporangium saharense]|uniref:Two-component system sensor histidine kinase DesK n=1 Tax=Streptosporangium saharense TaxID=1706840 RepID=A0A7W7QJ82_9ACTN|nr:histidine kinase [Streptosporangium saharense]MBB4914559.1 two-component system sensor histidine kinase DesK [Streptosporangium saharense]